MRIALCFVAIAGICGSALAQAAKKHIDPPGSLYGYRLTLMDDTASEIAFYAKLPASYSVSDRSGHVSEYPEASVKSIVEISRRESEARADARLQEILVEQAKQEAAAKSMIASDAQSGKRMTTIPPTGDDPRGYLISRADGQQQRVASYSKDGRFYRIKSLDGKDSMLYDTSVWAIKLLPDGEIESGGAATREKSRLDRLTAKEQSDADRYAPMVARDKARIKARYEARMDAPYYGWDSTSGYSGGGYYMGPRQPSGHYAGGVGSSHAGGHYVNPYTGNHYQRR